MIKAISFIALTQFFHFKFNKATRLLHFFKLNQQYIFFTVYMLTLAVA